MPISPFTIAKIRVAVTSKATIDSTAQRLLQELDRLAAAGDDRPAIQRAWADASKDLACLVLDGTIHRHLVDALADEVLALIPLPKEERQQVNETALGALDGLKTAPGPLESVPLDVEVSEKVHEAFILRALALYPERLLPPGKSILSLFMRKPEEGDEDRRKQAQAIANTIKRAFWDVAYNQLSSPEPQLHLPRLKTFYGDLHDALRPFLRPDHPLLVALSSPLSPTSNPLRSGIRYLRASLVAMRALCAPVRDETIDTTLQKLDTEVPVASTREELARAYVDGIKSALEIGEVMQQDFHDFMAKYGDEGRVRLMFQQSGKEAEREAIGWVFGPTKTLEQWRKWAGVPEAGARPRWWLERLIPVLSQLESITTQVEEHPGYIPPVLALCRLDLMEMQNAFQGLVICASLRTLVPALPPSRRTQLQARDPIAAKAEEHFSQRLWTLLGVDPFTSSTDTSTEDPLSIAEEVVQLWKLRNPPSGDSSEAGSSTTKEKSIREMAIRMVNEPEHPVRKLLTRRLLKAVEETLQTPLLPSESSATPMRLESGRPTQSGFRLKPSRAPVDLEELPLVVQGFDDPFLRDRATAMVKHLRANVIDWVEFVWSDIISNA